ncbi:ABC transporter ATP-binding protein [Methanospirillum hungatei]|uniref:ABC transporter ATP-binding protein n=1 Tax=Methanospirillum hungatei TaxID=2203 RepID=UPI0026EAA5D9|nr:ATP-binding cassette domain-containing protein [Methanospirillum hungatei]MCA1916894.1 ATP-binding cassette domain-containing protein [Methanospirillum hungatei]
MLEVQLKKSLRDFDLDVSLSVRSGEVLVLLGENGSGKSTTLNLLAGLLNPDEGIISLNERILYSGCTSVELPPEDRNIGYVFQNYALFPHMSAFENVAFGLRRRSMASVEIHKRVQHILDDLGVGHLMYERVTNLSGGQRQRVALARALVIQPDLLLLDEPLTALDRQAREKIRIELREELVKSCKPSIIVTHSLKDAEIMGDRVIILAEGKIIWTGQPNELEKHSGSPQVRYISDEYISFSKIAID